MYYSEHVQTWLTAKESFWPEWCSCNWNTGGRSPVQVSPSGIFYESDGEWLPNLFLWTYWTHILIQVHVFGTLHVKMSKCALNLKASSSKTSDRKSGRKPKKTLCYWSNHWQPYTVCAQKKFMELDSKLVLIYFKSHQQS